MAGRAVAAGPALCQKGGDIPLPNLDLTAMATATEARIEDRLTVAFEQEERAAWMLVVRVRLWASALIAGYALLWDQGLVQLFWAACGLTFGLLGPVYRIFARSRLGGPWQGYLFVTADAVLLTALLLWRNPFLDQPWPLAMSYRYPGFLYFFVLLALTALTFAPRVVLWSGIASAMAWSVGIAVVLGRPGVFSELDLTNITSVPTMAHLATFLDPYFVALDGRAMEIFTLLVVAGILATAVSRSRRLARTQIMTERARANLTRYFSPSLVDQLAASDAPFGPVRSATVAVLFADIVGFTRLSESADPQAVIRVLRDFHGRMARAVFDNNGTVDKYIGDCIMATFGTPQAGPRDAWNALACARAMLDRLDAFNDERRAEGKFPLAIGIGLHYGPAVLGDIGDERRVEFAVIGDTVNVASRLEALTRESGSPLLVSDETVEAARREGAGPADLSGLVEGGETGVRGRDGRIRLWALAPDPAKAAALPLP
jgi:adenylate cyclase